MKKMLIFLLFFTITVLPQENRLSYTKNQIDSLLNKVTQAVTVNQITDTLNANTRGWQTATQTAQRISDSLSANIRDWQTAIQVANRISDSLNARGTGGAGQLVISINSNASGNFNLLNQSSAELFLGNSSRNIIKVDLTNYTQVRLTVRVMTPSASPNDPRLYVEYVTSFSELPGDYQDIGTTVVGTSLSTATLVDSGWIDLVSGAKTDVFVAVFQNGGDGVEDPALGQIHLHFR